MAMASGGAFLRDVWDDASTEGHGGMSCNRRAWWYVLQERGMRESCLWLLRILLTL
jgi:hypothetical protein